MERGVVVSPAKLVVTGDGFSVSSGMSDDEFRFFLLYWDKISAPTDNFIHVVLPEEEFLISEKILERPRTRLSGSFSGGEAGIAILNAQAAVAKKKLEDKGVEWVIHQFGENLILPPSKKASQQVLRFDLLSALPVPATDVPMADILDFKVRRADECKALHECIDDLYLEILASPDTDLSAKKAVHRLKTAIQDLEASQKERFALFKKFSLSIETDGKSLADFAPVALGLFADIASGGSTMGAGTVAGGLAGFLKISSTPKDFFAPAKGKNKLSYLSSARKDGVVK